MKIMGIMTASLAAVFIGARLVFAAFSPVLPPDFERKWDPAYASAVTWMRWIVPQAAEVYTTTGAWPTDLEGLFSGPRHAEWKERNPRAWRSWVDQFADDVEIQRSDTWFTAVVTNAYEAYDDPDEAEIGGRNLVACTVSIDRHYARAYDRWAKMAANRRAVRYSDELEPLNHADCRRLTGIRAWLSWAGTDRYRRPPPERYSQLTYAEQAWRRAGIEPPEIDLNP